MAVPPAYFWGMPGRLLLVCLLLSLLVAMQGPSCRAAGPYHDFALELEGYLSGMPAADSVHKEPQRLMAAVLAVTLGPFAAHRLYLGTDVKVPIAYGLTFGGFGVLVLIDLAHILFTKDLQPYRNNHKVLMWAKPEPGGPTPP